MVMQEIPGSAKFADSTAQAAYELGLHHGKMLPGYGRALEASAHLAAAPGVVELFAPLTFAKSRNNGCTLNRQQVKDLIAYTTDIQVRLETSQSHCRALTLALERDTVHAPGLNEDTARVIEHARYICAAWGMYMQRFNERGEALENLDDPDELEDGYNDAVNDCWRAITNAVFEFEKRANRLTAPAQPDTLIPAQKLDEVAGELAEILGYADGFVIAAINQARSNPTTHPKILEDIVKRHNEICDVITKYRARAAAPGKREGADNG